MSASLRSREIMEDAPGKKLFLMGNEAIARGAIEAGVRVAAAYPGTPSSEVLMTLGPIAREVGMHAEWSVNEKVAVEVAMAASICGLRAIACMKHVGLNVAHDPLMTAAHIGARGGLIIFVADDPWAWSSQNEQDSRWVGKQANIPILEPSDIQEAKDMTVEGFDLSEKYNQPFLLRGVTRLTHGRGDVVLGPIRRLEREATFIKDPSWLTYVPATARKNKPLMLERFERISREANNWRFNSLELADGARLGIMAGGMAYSHTIEAVKWLRLEGKVSILKIGVTNPIPKDLVMRLLESVEKVLVVEELDSFIEFHIKAIVGEKGFKVKVHGKDLVPKIGELTVRDVTEAIAKFAGISTPIDFNRVDETVNEVEPLIPLRPPIMCAGCGYRPSYYAIKKAAEKVARELYGKKVEPIYPNDIGCYTLGILPPFQTADTCICMGGGAGLANGFAQVLKAPIIAIIGDSTFFHAGIPPLINAVYNKARFVLVILDNMTTAMTGSQDHPGSGKTAMEEPTTQLKPEDVARGCGVKFVEVVDPYDIKKATEVMERALKFDGPAVVVMRKACALNSLRQLKAEGKEIKPYRINQDKCERCEVCIKTFACPPIIKVEDKIVIDSVLCWGCGVCAQICPYEAIVPGGNKN